MACWHFYRLDRAHANLINLTLTVQKRGNTALSEDIHYLADELYLEITEQDRDLNRPLLTFLDAWQETVRSYPEAVETVTSETVLLGTATEMLEQLRKTLSGTIKKHADNFELNDWMLEEHLEELETLGIDNVFADLYSPRERPDVTTYPWFRELVHEHFLLVCRELLYNTNALVSRACFTIDVDFPVLLEPIGTVTAGEQASARLAVGTYRTPHAPENIRFLIDGEEFGVGYDGILEYSFVPKHKGVQALDVGLQVRSPLAGQVKYSEVTLSYRVR